MLKIDQNERVYPLPFSSANPLSEKSLVSKLSRPIKLSISLLQVSLPNSAKGIDGLV